MRLATSVHLDTYQLLIMTYIDLPHFRIGLWAVAFFETCLFLRVVALRL